MVLERQKWLTSTAERRGDRIVVNGFKRWCTGSVEQRISVIKNLSFFIIPTDAPGFSITSIETIGCHGVPTNDVALDSVELLLDYVVGGEGGWNNGWSLLAGLALVLGIAQAAVSEAWQYSQDRKQFGKRICGHQAVRHQLANAKTKQEACRLMLAHATWLVQEDKPSAVQTSTTKLYVAETSVEVVLSCQRILGAYGYAERFGMERYVRDILVMPIFGGSSAMQKNNIANLLRLPRK